MPRTPPTPLNLAHRTIAGCALLISGCLVPFLPFQAPAKDLGLLQLLWAARIEILVTLTPLLAGMVLAFRGPSQLGKGIRKDRWTEQQLDEARHWNNQPIFPRLAGGLVFAYLIYVVCCLAGHHHLGWSYALIYALNPYSSLTQTLRKPANPRSEIDWQAMKPIHSAHWGNPANS